MKDQHTNKDASRTIHGIPSKIIFMDEAAGVFKDIPIASPDKVCIGWDNVDIPPVDIATSFDFTCLLDGCTYNGGCWMRMETEQWRHAVDLADKLNDLIEEYHTPGNFRRVRKMIRRQFDKAFRTFLKHCRRNRIDFIFTRTQR